MNFNHLMNGSLIFFTESESYEITWEEDIRFMSNYRGSESSSSLISPNRGKWKINFVGEVKTPNATYFSFPKNVYHKNVENPKKLIDDLYKILDRFSKDDSGRSFVVRLDGDFSSHRYYFELLKKFFLDYVTYEFIYPAETQKIHSDYALDGEISVLDTVRNRKMYGRGITYLVKDVENSDKWMLDDIYYYTLQNLKNRLGISERENRDLENMSRYILSSGHKINKIENNKIISKSGEELLDMTDSSEVLRKIKECDVDIIHLPIKNTLLGYYGDMSRTRSVNSVNVVFTSFFERVWETIIQQALGCKTQESKDFKNELVGNFSNFEIDEIIVSTNQHNRKINEYPINGKELGLSKWSERSGDRWRLCTKGRRLLPDIFVELSDGRRFLGDAKYYREADNSDFSKEMGDYNDAQGNLYPMVVFTIPRSSNINNTTLYSPRGYRRRENSPNELIIINVSVQDVIDDAINGTKKVLEKSVFIIQKYTRRETWTGQN